MKKVYAMRATDAYRKMFEEVGWEWVCNPNEADVVLFTGGPDIDPDLYGEEFHPKTVINLQLDNVETSAYNRYLGMGLAMVGICRGAQLLNVMNGGSLYQHVDGHAIHGTHTATDIVGFKKFPVTSTHHQMMIPGDGGEVLLIAGESTKQEGMDGNNVCIDSVQGIDIEAVRYGNVLCYQPHPESVDKDHPCQVYFFEQLEKIL